MAAQMPASMREIPHDATTLAGAYGLNGYVVPSAGEEGGQPGWRHDRVASIAYVDPHLQGSFALEPAKITKEAAAAAARQFDVRQPGTDMEAARAMAKQALASIASVTGAMPIGQQMVAVSTPPLPPAPPLGQAAYAGHAEFAAPPAPQAVFQQPPQPQPTPQSYPPQPPGASYGVASMLPAVPTSLFSRQPTPQKPMPAVTLGPAPPPTIEIKYEIAETNGVQIPANFHEVIVNDRSLILVFDKRALGFPCAFPQDLGRDVAICLMASGTVYLCSPPKHRFQFQHYEFCVFEVTQEA